jgi:hypothetical protein
VKHCVKFYFRGACHINWKFGREENKAEGRNMLAGGCIFVVLNERSHEMKAWKPLIQPSLGEGGGILHSLFF